MWDVFCIAYKMEEKEEEEEEAEESSEMMSREIPVIRGYGHWPDASLQWRPKAALCKPPQNTVNVEHFFRRRKILTSELLLPLLQNHNSQSIQKITHEVGGGGDIHLESQRGVLKLEGRMASGQVGEDNHESGPRRNRCTSTRRRRRCR